MNEFKVFLSKIDDDERRKKLENVLTWVQAAFPELHPVIKWRQPMFVLDKTYIIGFSVSKNHIAVAPELVTLKRFAKEIEAAGYGLTKQLFQIKWASEVDYQLLERIIRTNIMEKAGSDSFWRGT